MIKRDVAFNVKRDEEILELCKALEKMGLNCTVESKDRRVKVSIYGYDKESLKENYRNVMSLIYKIKNKYNPDKRGLYKYYLSELKYPVNKELVMETLKALGYKVIYNEDESYIKTDVDIDTFNSILENLFNISNELRFSRLGSKPVKNLVVLVSYINGVPPEDVIEEALEKGFFRVEEGRIVLNKSIELAKKYFLEGEDGGKDTGEKR